MTTHTAIATDDFNRANGALGSNWTASLPVSDLLIASNVVKANSSVDNNIQFWNNGTFSVNQYGQVKISTTPSASGAWMGPSVRTTATDAVWLQCTNDNTGLEMAWYNGGAFTAIGGAYSGGGWSTNDVAVIEALGGGFFGYQNGTLRITGYNASAPTTGRPGIVITDTTGRIDDFEGGDCLSHVADTATRFTGSSSPLTQSFTCAAGTSVLVLDIVTLGATDRAGGAPTYDGVAMTQANSTQKAASSPEVGAELWYLIGPATGSSKTISIPNTGSKTLYCYASSWKAPTGYTSALDQANGANNTSANPSPGAITTTVNGDLVYAVLGAGNNSPVSGRSHIILNETDTGNQTDNRQYLIQPTAGAVTMSWTLGSDDWGSVVASFKLVASGTTYTPTYTETVTLTDTILKSSGRVLSDTVTHTDSIIRSIVRTLSDTVNHTDTNLKSTGRTLTDTVSHTDTLTTLRTAFGTFTDTLTHTDTIIRSIARTLTDTVTHTDTFISLRTAFATLTDTVTHSDVLVRAVGKLASETVTLTDTVIRSIGRILSDTVNHVDTVLKDIGRILTDSITHTDIFAGIKITAATLTETTSLSDTIIRSVGRILTETVNHTDSLIRSIIRILTDTVTHSDSVLKSSGRVLSESISVRDGATPGMSFNGTNALVTFGNILTSNTVVTAAIRLIPLRNSTSNYDVAFGYGNVRWFLIFMGNTTRIAFNVRAPSTEKSSGYPATALTIGKRYTVIGTYDPDAGSNNITVRIYDEYGALVDSASNTITGALGTTAQPLQIAHDPNRNFWMGMVARDARVWGRVLSIAEQNNFALEVEPDATSLLLKVTADEGSPATTVSDTSPTGATGTLTNVTWVDFKRGLLISLQRSLSDTSSLTDTIIRSLGRILTDDISLSDIFAGAIYNISKILTETISLSDSFVRLIGRIFSESFSILDIFSLNLNGKRWYIKLINAYNSLVNTVWESHNNTSYKDNNNSNWYTENDTDWKDPL